MPQQKILTKEIINRMPGPSAQENEADPIVHLKVFNPYGQQVWLITEAWQVVQKPNGEYAERPLKTPLAKGEKCLQRIGFGWAMLFPGCGEYGTVDLDELLSTRVNVLGRPMPLEREQWESDGKHRVSQLKPE